MFVLCFRLGKNTPSEKVASMVDSTVLHKALFKSSAREDSAAKPVTFTVKI